ncbi:Fanconi anemia group D2 protein isoform a [Corchorus olitorius]|uniref:Fanconi anemia group D2 protein isoform a n=1 Tax=Corchorus olitorius TaxID=93759 RepID=A0A1R3J2L7_9ROSI|nr:Fanconi anemia group D2 protein isoform a [Corchorus olitorius]
MVVVGTPINNNQGYDCDCDHQSGEDVKEICEESKSESREIGFKAEADQVCKSDKQKSNEKKTGTEGKRPSPYQSKECSLLVRIRWYFRKLLLPKLIYCYLCICTSVRKEYGETTGGKYTIYIAGDKEAGIFGGACLGCHGGDDALTCGWIKAPRNIGGRGSKGGQVQGQGT